MQLFHCAAAATITGEMDEFPQLQLYKNMTISGIKSGNGATEFGLVSAMPETTRSEEEFIAFTADQRSDTPAFLLDDL